MESPSSRDTQFTWSGSEDDKPRELLESELSELRTKNKENEQELRRLRQLLAYGECRGQGEEDPAKYESRVLLEHELQAKDFLIAELEQKLQERSQQLMDELSKRKTAQYKQIHSGHALCDLLSQISRYQDEISMLQAENLSLRLGGSVAREEKREESSPAKCPLMAGMHDDASTFSPLATVKPGEAPRSTKHSMPSETSLRKHQGNSSDCGPRGGVGVRTQHIFPAASINNVQAMPLRNDDHAAFSPLQRSRSVGACFGRAGMVFGYPQA